jgi:hypothetical protein
MSEQVTYRGKPGEAVMGRVGRTILALLASADTPSIRGTS